MAISTKNIISSLSDIDVGWGFKHYLNLPDPLNGEEVKFISVFNPSERTPSMTVYPAKNGTYKYKCFSSGNSGGLVDLVEVMFKLSKSESIQKVMADYKFFLQGGGISVDVSNFKQQAKYKLSGHTMRVWDNRDKGFWRPFIIGSKELERWNIAALSGYILSKEVDGKIKSISINQDLIYGMFDKTGEIYKIYQPHSKTCKFFKVKSYLPGIDQLTYSVPNLLITKSIKDIISFTKLGIVGWEAVSCESENTIIPEKKIIEFKGKYKKIRTLFDNDVAGKQASETYESKFELSPVYLELSKDCSDSVRDFGQEKVREKLIQLLL